MRVLKVIIVIFVITIFSIIGYFVRNSVLDKQIADLEDNYLREQAIADSMALEINMSDADYKQDKQFLDNMFSDIFTFNDIAEFNDAKTNAKSFNLSDDFIDRFYDTTELSNSYYTEAMLDVMCRYDSSKLYLLDRDDSVGYYFAVVTLDMVKYNSSVRLGLFITLADSGDENERVKSMIYYNVS